MAGGVTGGAKDKARRTPMKQDPSDTVIESGPWGGVAKTRVSPVQKASRRLYGPKDGQVVMRAGESTYYAGAGVKKLDRLATAKAKVRNKRKKAP